MEIHSPLSSRQSYVTAVREAVEAGLVWLSNGPTSLWREPVPDDVLTEEALLAPPAGADSGQPS